MSDRRPFLLAFAAICTLLTACNGAGSNSVAPSVAAAASVAGAPAPPPPPEVSEADVLAAVSNAATIDAIPAGLTPVLEHADEDTEQVPKEHCVAPTQTFEDALFGECLYGDVDATKQVVLFGDSHAGMWSTSLHLAGLRGGWSLRVYEQGGCPAPRITFFKNDAPNTGCDLFRDAAIKEIVRIAPDVIVVTSGTFFQRTGRSTSDFAKADEWQTGLEGVLHDLTASGARLIVLGDLPVLEQPAPECLAAHAADVSACATSRDKALENVYHDAERAAAGSADATYIDPTSWFCTETCTPIVGETLVYRNKFHISATYAAYLSGVVRLAIGPVGE